MLFNSKSHGTFNKTNSQDLENRLKVIQSELRHQRNEHSVILGLLSKIFNSMNLQKQVDDFFDEEEASHQTDSIEHGN